MKINPFTYNLFIVLYFLKLGIILIRVPLRLLYGKNRRDRILYSPRWSLYHWLIDQMHHVNALLVTSGIIPHEQNVVNIVKRLRGKLAIDVGAYYGYYSLLLSNFFQKVIAVEPNPKNFRMLQSNTSKIPNIHCIGVAVNDRDGTCSFYIPYGGAHGRSPIALSELDDDHLEAFKLYTPRKIKVKTVTLARLLGNSYTDLVKVDVEGAEFKVLKGAESVADRIKAWIVELHNLKRKEELESWFIKQGYKVNWLGARHIYAWRD